MCMWYPVCFGIYETAHFSPIMIPIIITLLILSTDQTTEGSKLMKRQASFSQSCSQIRSDGYECTLRKYCGADGYIEKNPNAIKSELVAHVVDDHVLDDSYALDEDYAEDDYNFEDYYEQSFNASEYLCENEREDVCCRKTLFFGRPPPVIRDIVEPEHNCDNYAEFGFECVEEQSCDEDGYIKTEQHINEELGIRQVQDGVNPSALPCSNPRMGWSQRVCCRRTEFYDGIECKI